MSGWRKSICSRLEARLHFVQAPDNEEPVSALPCCMQCLEAVFDLFFLSRFSPSPLGAKVRVEGRSVCLLWALAPRHVTWPAGHGVIDCTAEV